jgi:hypothetical protein
MKKGRRRGPAARAARSGSRKSLGRIRKNIGTTGWLGIAVGVAAVGGLAWWLLKRRRQPEAAPAAETTSPGIDAVSRAITPPRLSIRLPSSMFRMNVG